ncbi:2'-5' RNA ligase family protein [Streptomyces sp. NBC_01381]|uniref:2'-5' RNA ligase family protein n=1 Tax=Streptomyces sp. NBC_01381 TaxID=2903845 RepID=UPI00224DB361|nr:2'-5' RNA ligase family protein [Streptomyces sp. NBC_01381]MCX4666466.1 2'-5' RNA ligase family protein [Streptomyces sp. NBC_01381]
MKKWTPSFQSRQWRDGMRVRHVYALPESNTDTELLALVEACRSSMASYPIDLQRDDLLHITIAMDTSVPADQMSQQDTVVFVAALRKELAGIPAFRVMCGPPIANKAGAVLDVFPNDELDGLQGLVWKALLDARGPSAVLYETGRPHASIGYSYDAADSDPLQSTLRAITPRHAAWTVSRVHVLDVAYHHNKLPDGRSAWQMSWERVAEIGLRSRHPENNSAGPVEDSGRSSGASGI